MNLSVIIPTLNEADTIVACLGSIRSQAADAEILVVDGGSVDATVTLARSYANVIAGPRGRAQQMNLGGRRARGDILLFLHADSRLHPAAMAFLDQVMRDPAIVGGTFTLWFDTGHYLLRFFASLTRFEGRIFRYGDQGIIVRRYMKRGVLRQQFLNIALVGAWLLGAPPETLARWYYGSPK